MIDPDGESETKALPRSNHRTIIRWSATAVPLVVFAAYCIGYFSLSTRTEIGMGGLVGPQFIAVEFPSVGLAEWYLSAAVVEAAARGESVVIGAVTKTHVVRWWCKPSERPRKQMVPLPRNVPAGD